MAWSTIRKATDWDYENLKSRAVSFIERHDIDIAYLAEDNGQTLSEYLEDTLNYDILHGQNPEEARYQLGLWKRIVKRALGHRRAEGIAYGYVGFSAD